MKRVVILLALTAALVAGGCASKERVYENLYEGLKGRERLMNQHEPIPPELPSYGQYKSERARILKEKRLP